MVTSPTNPNYNGRRAGHRIDVVGWIFSVLVVVALLPFAFVMVQRAKTRAENIARNTKRSRILGALKQKPGSSLQRIADQLGIVRGTVQYHMFMLHRVNAVEDLVSGRERHFFTPGIHEEKARAISVLQRRWGLPLVLFVLEHPGTIQKDITAQLGIRRKALRQYVKMLSAEGLLIEECEKRTRIYRPTPKLVNLLQELSTEIWARAHAQETNGGA